MKEQHPAEAYECYICHRRASSRMNLRHHMTRSHVADRMTRCKMCNKLISTTAPAHQCNEPDDLSCELCATPCQTFASLRKHLNDAHVEQRRFKCEICRHVFPAQNMLTIHEQIHADKVFTCDLCSKQYASQAALKHHRQNSHFSKGEKM